MDRLDDIEAFIAIIEKGGQTAAARHLRRSLQSINRSLATLERSVGTELLRRTTRQSRPTEAGLAFYRRVKPALAEINEAKREAGSRNSEPSGLLRIGTPVLFAPAYIAPAACSFMERYPRIEIDLHASDRPVDILKEDLDLAVRIRHMPDSALRARRLGEMRTVVFGTPAYFAKFGRPDHPDDLASHQCVIRTADAESEMWTFRIDGKPRTVRVNGRFRTDSTAAGHAVVADGFGIGFTPLWQIRNLVDKGLVEIVLESFEAPRVPIHAVWPASKRPLLQTRLFVDHLAATMKRHHF